MASNNWESQSQSGPLCKIHNPQHSAGDTPVEAVKQPETTVNKELLDALQCPICIHTFQVLSLYGNVRVCWKCQGHKTRDCSGRGGQDGHDRTDRNRLQRLHDGFEVSRDRTKSMVFGQKMRNECSVLQSALNHKAYQKSTSGRDRIVFELSEIVVQKLNF